MVKIRLSKFLAVNFMVMCVLSSTCGYSLSGRGTFIPDDIQTIGVPVFENGTTFFDVEQLLTDRVRSEFIGRGNYRIVPQADSVDAVVDGTIRSIRITPASFTDDLQASRYTFTLRASISFRDLRTDEVLWANPNLVFTEEYDVATGGDALDPSTFFGQDSNALTRITEDFAEAVVSAILEAF